MQARRSLVAAVPPRHHLGPFAGSAHGAGGGRVACRRHRCPQRARLALDAAARLGRGLHTSVPTMASSGSGSLPRVAAALRALTIGRIVVTAVVAWMALRRWSAVTLALVAPAATLAPRSC